MHVSVAMPSIVSLLFRSRPFTIGRFVIAIIIDALERVASFSRPHISEKIFKFEPPFAELNSTTPIQLIVSSVRIAATFEHARPAFIGWGSILTMSKIVAFKKQTTARTYFSAFKRVGGGEYFVSAGAGANPNYTAIASPNSRFNRTQSTKTLICDIESFGHE